MNIKKEVVIFLLFSLFSVLVWGDQKSEGGSLVIIGGALEHDNSQIYNQFIELGGGKKNIRIAILPAASETPVKTGKSFMKSFISYGVGEAQIKLFPLAVIDDPSTKEVDESLWSKNGFKTELAEEIRHFNAVFLVGGSQKRYLKTLKTGDGKDSPMLTAIREIYQKGGVIGGSSAGAAIMCDPMICGGKSLEALQNGAKIELSSCPSKEKAGVRIGRGLGFFEWAMVDQHFIKRGRIGRLITALFHLEDFSLGIGIDEDTAVVYYEKSKSIEVMGRSGAVMVDIQNAEVKFKKDRTEFNAKNILLHYLEAGDSYNMKTGEFCINRERKKIERGKEYYKTYPLNTNIFGKDVLGEIITRGIANSQQDHAVGISFNQGDNGQKGHGVKMIFRKGKKTVGYQGRINRKRTHTALFIYLDIVPIEVMITEY